jgi:hypothetical protein
MYTVIPTRVFKDSAQLAAFRLLISKKLAEGARGNP